VPPNVLIPNIGCEMRIGAFALVDRLTLRM